MTGREREHKMKECPDCKGNGRVFGPRLYPGRFAFRPLERCGRCGGAGRVRKYPPRKRAGADPPAQDPP